MIEFQSFIYVPGWNPCKPRAEDTPAIVKRHAVVTNDGKLLPCLFNDFTPAKNIFKVDDLHQHFENKQSHGTMPRSFKLYAEDLRRGVHGFHPGIHVALIKVVIESEEQGYSHHYFFIIIESAC